MGSWEWNKTKETRKKDLKGESRNIFNDVLTKSEMPEDKGFREDEGLALGFILQKIIKMIASKGRAMRPFRVNTALVTREC